MIKKHNNMYYNIKMEKPKITKKYIEKKTFEKIKYKESLNIIKPLIKNKIILDCGAAQHSIKQILKSDKPWIHAFLSKYAKKIEGIDLAEDAVKKFKSLGYNIKLGNVEEMNYNNKFEVIFAGDLIEHLSNPGKFLNKSYIALKPKGKLILTTPNTFSFLRILRVIFGFTNNPKVNPEHTFWFSPKTIKELIRREGFKNIKVHYYSMNHGIIFWLSKIIGKKFLNNMMIITEK